MLIFDLLQVIASTVFSLIQSLEDRLKLCLHWRRLAR
jgi:hypothetical protein